MSTSGAITSENIESVIAEQVGFFTTSELIRPLTAREILLGQTALTCVESSELYRDISASVTDDPKTDTLRFVIDEPTLQALENDYVSDKELDSEDILRMYIGIGLARLLVVKSLSGAGRVSKIRKFLEEISTPQGLYAQTMDSEIFDDVKADETARAIVADGYTQTAKVNAVRLTTGAFIEVQPKPGEFRRKIENTFQNELGALFLGKEIYVRTVGLFNVNESGANNMYANNVEIMMGLSFPMAKKEVSGLLKVLH